MHKKKILIVDDEKDFAQIVKMNLEQTGEYEVRTESRAAKAIACAKSFMPDVILLDIVMPDKDGFEVLGELKKNPKTVSIPVIMLTAVGGNHAKMTASQKFCEDYITKPVPTEELKAKIEEVIKRHLK